MFRMIAAAVALLPLSAAPAWAQAIVNIGHDLGFTYDSGGSDPAPVAGQHINFIGPVPTLDLAAGTYQITNATGLAGANPDYTAWSYNVGTSGWAWAFVAATSTGTVITYGEGGRGSSKAAVAALPGVTGFLTTFTLAAPTRVAFTLRDYYVPDNAGGVALRIARLGSGGVPEPATWATMVIGFMAMGGMMRRRRRAATALA